ncbi:hypothetical protein D3C78_1688720 [compost metagenome]
MVSKRLADTAEAFATYGYDRNSKLLAHFFGNCLNIIANQTNRTFGLNTNPFGKREHFFNLPTNHFKLLIPAKYNIRLLKIA